MLRNKEIFILCSNYLCSEDCIKVKLQELKKRIHEFILVIGVVWFFYQNPFIISYAQTKRHTHKFSNHEFIILYTFKLPCAIYIKSCDYSHLSAEVYVLEFSSLVKNNTLTTRQRVAQIPKIDFLLRIDTINCIKSFGSRNCIIQMSLKVLS